MPYENEHSCRLEDPGKYDDFRREDCGQKHEGKCIDVIYGIKTKPKRKSEIQALRYPVKVWTAGAASSHCKSRGGSFEKAKGQKEGAMELSKEDLKMAYPELITGLEQEALKRGQDEGFARGKEEGLTQGAEAERKRIKDVEDQQIPGHEALIGEMKYDGKTTGAEAAMRILAAEKLVKADVLRQIREGRIKPVAQPSLPMDGSGQKPKTFNEAVELLMKERKLTRPQAISAVAKEMPELHEAYIAEERERQGLE